MRPHLVEQNALHDRARFLDTLEMRDWLDMLHQIIK